MAQKMISTTKMMVVMRKRASETLASTLAVRFSDLFHLHERDDDGWWV